MIGGILPWVSAWMAMGAYPIKADTLVMPTDLGTRRSSSSQPLCSTESLTAAGWRAPVVFVKPGTVR